MPHFSLLASVRPSQVHRWSLFTTLVVLQWKRLVEEPGNSSYHFFSIFFADLASLIPGAPIGAKGDPQNKKIRGSKFWKTG